MVEMVVLPGEQTADSNGSEQEWDWDGVLKWSYLAARKMRLEHYDAEDIAGAIVLRLLGEDPSQVKNQRAYVWQKSVWEVLTRWRRSGKVSDDFEVSDAADQQVTSKHALESARVKQEVRDLLMDLNEADRWLLEQKYFARLKSAEIAEILGIEPSAAAMRCYRLVLKLGKLYES